LAGFSTVTLQAVLELLLFRVIRKEMLLWFIRIEVAPAVRVTV